MMEKTEPVIGAYDQREYEPVHLILIMVGHDVYNLSPSSPKVSFIIVFTYWDTTSVKLKN